ncbi:MAG TPA: hypothetical protein VGR15_09560 [Bacteroidota bacterium]|nr:hypothetical protein [Bacteroidota bacterium]
MLHITNGDSPIPGMRSSGIPGDIIAWREVLHEGPVPGNLSLDELRPLHARFIADQGWGEYEKVLEDC